MEVWYTDKKRGIRHGEVADSRIDYCGRRFFLVNGKWLQEDRLFKSEKELRDCIDEYVRSVRRWDDYESLGETMSGYCVFRCTGKRDWL